MPPTVRALHRYPVKGFPGEQLNSARVEPGAGVPRDRILALAEGPAAAVTGRWQRWSAFLALKKRADLAAWRVLTLPDGRISLTPPGTGAPVITVDPAELRADPAEPAGEPEEPAADPAAVAAAHLPGASPLAFSTAYTATTAQGMFDEAEGHLSLISLDSVRALERLAGEPIDPLRFRGNLLIEGLAPFAEFDLVGSTVRMGGATVLIRSTIERCAATKVRPGTALADLNVPRLLASGLGHIHMGVYGTVLEPGLITPGDSVEVLPASRRPSLPAGTGPRRMRVLESYALEPGRHCLRLRDPYGWFAEAWAAGCHIRVHLALGGQQHWRSYTAVLVSGNELSLVVQSRGAVSRALAQLSPGEGLLVSGPFGALTPEALPSGTPGPIAVLTAGVGITTALSLLPGLPSACAVRVLHVDRGTETGSTAALARLCEGYPDREVRVWDTSGDGRPGPAALTDFLAGASAAVVCGGETFVADACAAAAEAGIPPSAVFRESFASPVADAAERLAGLAPARVVRAGGRVLDWTPDSGTLLETLEADGARVPFTCRSGSCGSCAVEVSDTSAAAHVLDHTAEPGPGRVLSCCAVPVGELHVNV